MKIKLKQIITLIFLFSIYIIPQTEFINGVDVSTLLQIEDNGGVFKENGITKDPILIFKDNGIDYIRLKLWHTPSADYDNLQKVLIAAERIKSNGLKFLLNIHYSDWWADPANQTKPAAWNGLTIQQLKDSVYQYTKNIITTLKNNNILPDMVQIGNEIICGMLWNDGRICDPYNTPQQWQNFADLIKAGINGVKDAVDVSDSVRIMIHTDRGGDNGGARWFYNGLQSYNVEFDIIGLSYYPWWQGTLSNLQNNLNDLAVRYGKEIIVVETAYPWTLSWDDNTTNIVGNPSQLLAGYPATVQGQKDFLIDLINIVKSTSGNKGVGLFYWEPDWISTQTFGSPWENLAMFDFSGELLSSVSAFDSTATSIDDDISQINEFKLDQNYPNPFNPKTSIQYTIGSRQFVQLNIFDVLGNNIATLVNENKESGSYSVKFDATNLPSGVYFYKLQAGEFTNTRKMILVK